MRTITTQNDTEPYDQDWGSEPPIRVCQGWALQAHAWEHQPPTFEEPT